MSPILDVVRLLPSAVGISADLLCKTDTYVCTEVLKYKAIPSNTLKYKISHEQPSPTLIGFPPLSLASQRRKIAASCRRTSEAREEKPPTERAQPAQPTTSRHQCFCPPTLPGLRACGSPVRVQRQPLVPPIRARRASKSRPGEPASLPVRRAN